MCIGLLKEVVMKKIFALILVLLSSFVSSAIYAADNNSAPVSLWEKLRKKVESFTPQKKISATNAVGGVRGALSDANDIYWKGEATHEEVDADEMDAFKKAMSLGETGETNQAQAAFASFIKEHPDSPLRKDADQALLALSK
jgi:TolA-binding protein